MDFKKSIRSSTVSQLPADYLIHRKILVEEIFEDLRSNTTFIRKINCQEVYDYQEEKLPLQLLENASTFENVGISSNTGYAVRSTKFQSVLLNYGETTNVENHKSDNHVNIATITDVCKETQMDIDSSSDQLITNESGFSKMNYSSRQLKFRKWKSKSSINKSTFSPHSETYTTLASVNEPLISRFSKILMIASILLLLIAVYIIVAGDYFIYVNKNIQLENIKRDLQEYVVHQEDAIKIIIHNFERIDSWRGIKVLPFIGSTGVGKTFTVNIIKKYFFPQLVHDIDTNQLMNRKKQHNMIANLNSCCCNLIIIDNLRASDFNDFMNFIDTLPKSFVLLVIPIFNIQDTVDGLVHTVKEDDFKFIRDEFENSKLYYEIVIFDMLKSHVIEKWLRKELHKRQISENRHDSLVKFLLDNNHAKYKGFKGLNSQLLLALDNN